MLQHVLEDNINSHYTKLAKWIEPEEMEIELNKRDREED